MKPYLSYYTAAAYWNIPYIEAVLGSEAHGTSTIEFTVSKRSAKYVKKNRTIYLCELPLPSGAVVSRNGTMVASPELLFLQLASRLDIHRLILLGLQLCSHPPGEASKAITSKRKLKIFLEKTSGHRGHRKAIRALKYIEDGSASVMESMTYMLLNLPYILGGYGLGGATFNYEVKLSDEVALRLGQKRCFVDLYYKSSKVAVEYDSFAFHNSPLKQGKDAVRSVALKRQSIEVMHLSTIQLYDKESFKDFAFILAARLEKRIHIRTKEFEPMNTLLRDLLPTLKADTTRESRFLGNMEHR
ncbi:MAG: hypothetical protein ACOX5F_04240 [Anaerovoracaceae bacterium]|jgi:hypothetical protein